jgi:hypothetical protein
MIASMFVLLWSALQELDPESDFVRAQQLRAEKTPQAMEAAVSLFLQVETAPTLTPLARFRVRLNRCSTLIEAGAMTEAAECAGSVEVPAGADASDHSALLHVGAIVARRSGDLPLSRRLLREAIEQVAKKPEELPLLNAAIAFAFEEYDLDEAERLTRRLRERVLVGDALFALPDLYLAQIAAERGQAERALALIRSYFTLAGDGAFVEARHLECDLLEALGRRTEAKGIRRMLGKRAEGDSKGWVSLRELRERDRRR